MNRCKECDSYAINLRMYGRDEGSDPDLCDVCYWRKRADDSAARIRELEAQAAAHARLWDEYELRVNRLTSEIIQLEEQIAAHEKVCAGVWVDVKERTPDEHRWFPGLYPGGFITDTKFREGDYYRYGDDEPTASITHWLDAKEPQP